MHNTHYSTTCYQPKGTETHSNMTHMCHVLVSTKIPQNLPHVVHIYWHRKSHFISINSSMCTQCSTQCSTHTHTRAGRLLDVASDMSKHNVLHFHSTKYIINKQGASWYFNYWRHSDYNYYHHRVQHTHTHAQVTGDRCNAMHHFSFY